MLYSIWQETAVYGDGGVMNAKEAEVLLEQSLENYANGCAGKQELIADIRKLWYLEEGDADAMQNVYLYLHLVKEVGGNGKV